MLLSAPHDPNGVRPASGDAGATLLVGGCRLDRRSGMLRRPDGSETLLRPKTVQLAVLLAANAGNLVSRSDILDAVWPGVFVTDDSITQCVVELRRALGPGSALLRTIPCRGYVLDRSSAAAEPSRDAR